MSVAEPSLQRIPMSWERYLALPEHPRAEWVDGVVVVTPQPSVQHQLFSRRLANHLERALPGLVLVEAYNRRLTAGRIRIPDVAAFSEMPEGVFVDQLPVLVAEILSPSTRSEDLLRKAPEYAEAGIGQLWLVDLDARSIEVSRNVEGRWELLAAVDDQCPTADVEVGEHGTVALDLDELLGEARQRG